MTLHPIKVLDHVIDEYRDHLRTEFRARDPQLRQSLEEALDTPKFLAQEPFYQAHRSFKPGARWKDLPLDPKLAAVMLKRAGEYSYSHQSEAITELLSPGARPVVVSTGTGSGKTEAFLLPVIQNAYEDAVKFKKSGLTAIIVYPMNALSNDQHLRIDRYLADAGFDGLIKVEQYDRGTPESEREKMRNNPPHILLTNYMMLEYLLVRPNDREAIFKNHRCRFLVLDEVHTYRGALGANVALLIRRTRTHLKRAVHDWMPNVGEVDQRKRFPELITAGTSATIKSTDPGLDEAEAQLQRTEAIQEFFSKLTGSPRQVIQVFSESIVPVETPAAAAYPPAPTDVIALDDVQIKDPERVRQVICELAGLPGSTPIATAAERCRLLWDLSDLLSRRPMSVSQIVQHIAANVPERHAADLQAVRREVEAALVAACALPDDVPAKLRLRAHRFIRGGWRFHRCINPKCGKLYPMGEEHCSECGCRTAPLYLCRSCGAHYLRLTGDPDGGTLQPSSEPDSGNEWMLFEYGLFDQALTAEDEEDLESEDLIDEDSKPKKGKAAQPGLQQAKGRPVLMGSFDPEGLQFSTNPDDYELHAKLIHGRSACLCCGSRGRRNLLTAVSLGTSAALKVIAEGMIEALHDANQGQPGYDGKDRLLIFSDSRQDAAHQARFITFASRYDRMRQHVVDLLKNQGELSLQKVIEELGSAPDNPYAKPGKYPSKDDLARMRYWEEAPLLDDLAVNAGFRTALPNLGLVGVHYDQLFEITAVEGMKLADELGLTPDQLAYTMRCLLDEIRARGALNRELLRYHPRSKTCPETMWAAEWERSRPVAQGYACDLAGNPLLYIDRTEIPYGLTRHNAWRAPKTGGRGPSTQRILENLVLHFGAVGPQPEHMLSILHCLQDWQFLVAPDLFGLHDKRKLLQVNHERVYLRLLTQDERLRCSICNAPRHLAQTGLPCPVCGNGKLTTWADDEVGQNRYVRRILEPSSTPLTAREHTAQVTHDVRAEIEEDFKAGPDGSTLNVLACSPTLEMGIDVGGLDAVAMRNIPPRPNNYAQRGGRAGRQKRVGLVVGYARSTPHDQYFYDHPEEMIAGEVAAPALALGNRDIIHRHVNAILFGATEPGLKGRMVEYVDPQGEIAEEAVQELIDALKSRIDLAVELVGQSFEADVLSEAKLDPHQLQSRLGELEQEIRSIFVRTSKQVKDLRQALEALNAKVIGEKPAARAASLVRRLLGIVDEHERQGGQTDDRSAGYPLRRFAEFGVLPGYEFPSEPATLRLLADDHEESPISTTRRFGIGQFQLNAPVYARAKRWKVTGLDTSSPWNPQEHHASWEYRICPGCEQRFSYDEPSCPRCKRPAEVAQPIRAFEYGGFLARRDESPVLDEEERQAAAVSVQAWPQRDGEIIHRWSAACGWQLSLSKEERVCWLNEGPAPSDQALTPPLHPKAKGFLVCSECGHQLKPQEEDAAVATRKAPKKKSAGALYGHREGCTYAAAEPLPVAITAIGKYEVLRLSLIAPDLASKDAINKWGYSLGYALLNGITRHFMLDSGELDFHLDGPWNVDINGNRINRVSLAFIDPSLGGSGYLVRVAEQIDQVAAAALSQLLDHVEDANSLAQRCETACYRCLKTYYNQRHHEYLCWPLAVPGLEALVLEKAAKQPLEAGDLDDSAAWLEAYAAGVGSPLELKFLRVFEGLGFHPEKQVPISADPLSQPISIADFAVPDKRIAIYIDGASIHVGANLRRDQYIRAKLRGCTNPWAVLELRASDLGKVAEMLRSYQVL